MGSFYILQLPSYISFAIISICHVYSRMRLKSQYSSYFQIIACCNLFITPQVPTFVFNPNFFYWPLTGHKSNSSNNFLGQINFEHKFVIHQTLFYWPLAGHKSIWPAQLLSGPYIDLWPANGGI